MDQQEKDWKRHDELLVQIDAVDRALAVANQALKDRLAARPDLRTLLLGNTMRSRINAMDLDPELTALERTRDGVVRKWNATLSEFADVKTRLRKEEVFIAGHKC